MRYAAFMRALNVGGRVVKMDELKKVFVKLGFANVESFIASGNIVFESPSTDRAGLERTIEAGLEKALGYASETFLRDFDQLAKIGVAEPFTGIVDAPTYLVGFIRKPLDAAAKKRSSLSSRRTTSSQRPTRKCGGTPPSARPTRSSAPTRSIARWE